MKKFSLLPIAAALAFAVSCEKPMSEADRNAQVEREVQQRLAAERTAADQQLLAQQQAELAAREQALADKEAAASETAVAVATPRATAEPEDEPAEQRSVSRSDNRSPRSYDTFYRKLEPYGSWRETDDYGFVWQPRQAQSRDWKPYTDGRWAYTDAGWTWVSSEPYGWATYHYGRWTRLRGVGWVWVPGEEWAPAWVSWRSSDQHVGWAPLPPEAKFERRTGIKKWADSYYDIDVDEYVFIPNEEIGSDHIERAILPAARNVTIVNETTNVTNITYNNTTIVNEGPNYEALRGRSRRPLERMRLERQYNVEESQAPQASVRGNVLAIMSPLFTARAVERPRNVGERITQVTVDRGSAANANQPEAQRARAKMKSEATPPPDAPPKRFDKPAIVAGTPAPAVAPTAAPAAATTPAPRATASPMISATPAVRPVTTPAPSAPSATPTPRVLPSATPISTPKPASTVTPAPKPLATPTPVATFTPRATPRPVVSAAPRMTPRAPSSPTAAPALVPRATVATTPAIVPPAGGGKPLPTATIRPPGNPRPGTDPAESFPPEATPSLKAIDQQRKRNEEAVARTRALTGGGSPAATIAPPSTAPPAAVRAVTPRATIPAATATPVRAMPKAPVPVPPPATTVPPDAQGRGRAALPPVATPPQVATPKVPPVAGVPPATAVVPAPVVPPGKKTPVTATASPTPTPTPTPGGARGARSAADGDAPKDGKGRGKPDRP